MAPNSFLRQLIQGCRERSRHRQFRGMRMSGFIQEVLGVDLWSKQLEVVEAVEDGNRRIHVKAGHSVGKTNVAACVAVAALECLSPPPIVITTAPTFRQVRDQLWREIREKWNSVPELVSLAEPLDVRIDRGPKHYAYGFSTNKPVRFQGIHGPRLLFIIDEANGFPDQIWESIDSCMSNKNAQLLAIGNPIIPYGRFFRGFQTEDRIKCITISSREHPNVIENREVIPGAVTQEWIADFEAEFNSSPEIIASRIDGVFPSGAAKSVVNRIHLANSRRNVIPKTLWPKVLSVDVARFGTNLTVVTRFDGQWAKFQKSWGREDTVVTANRVSSMFEAEPVDAIVVDDDGIGGGVTDILVHRGLPVVAFKGGQKANEDARFVNATTEAWWNTRTLLEMDLLKIGFESNSLDVQLTTREWSMQAGKRIAIEPKDKYTKRTGMASPDHADSLTMGVWYISKRWVEAGLRAAS